MPLQTLENEFWRLTVSPEFGASIYALQHKLFGAWTPIMRPSKTGALEAGCSADFASYTLMPYSNRIRDGRFVFHRREHKIKANWPDGQVIHGDVRETAWRTTRQGALTLVCEVDSKDLQVNFPFEYRARCTYRLEGSRFLTELCLQNTDVLPMPAGFGIHPYFERRIPTPKGPSGDAELCFVASGWYDTPDRQNPIPLGAAGPIPTDLNFREARAASDQFIDGVYNGFAGLATLAWPGSGWRLRLEASPAFSHFVVFTAPDGTLALEPVSNATDGFNLHAAGVPGTGVVELAPGEELIGSVVLMLENTGL